MSFLRLIRPVNLFIIACTMYSIRLFFLLVDRQFNIETSRMHGEPMDFLLLVFSTVLIAAAGNIINDYFDVRADRVNKPDRVIIGRYIKKRWAIILHWTFNLSAFAIAVYLGFRYHTFWYVFIHLLSINSLWFYSMSLKRKPLSGNLVVAGLTALVPILCGVHFYIQNSVPDFSTFPQNNPADLWLMKLADHGIFVYLLAFFAFFGNLSREIVKDVQDIPGDKLLHAKTLPILIGAKNAQRAAALFLLFSPAFYIVIIASGSYYGLLPYSPRYTLPADLSVLLQLICFLLLLGARAGQRLRLIDRLLKLSMLAGILWPVYWYILF